MKLIVATHNAHKVKEFERILAPLGFEVLSQSSLGIEAEAEENAGTFEGNAFLKAKAVYDECGLATIADDSGLEVYALKNEPGVYSARYGGPGLDDAGRTRLLLQNMENISEEERGGRFVCAISYIDNSGKAYSFTGYCEGKIGHTPQGENGFGYDPVFLVGEKSFSELSPAEKDSVSHRGQALRKLAEFLGGKSEKPSSDI